MSRRREHGPGEQPMSLDDLARIASIPDRGEPPAELNAVSNVVNLSVSGAANTMQTHEISFRPVDLDRPGRAEGYEIVSRHELTLGLNVRETLRADLPLRGHDEAAELEPFIPRWSGIEYAPRISSSRRVRKLRRRSGALVTPEYVFAPDERQVYYPSGYPWRCIGRIFVWNNASAVNWAWSGSAALVSKNSILTCSHVVPWGATSWKALFVPGYYDGASVYGANAASWVQTARGYQDHDQGDDMATMRLYQPLGDWLGYFGYKTYNDDWEDGPYWTLAGYPGMVASGQRPSIQYGFPITDDDNDGAGVELEYKADSSAGNSGGPVFGWWSNAPYVIGTHSGGEDNFGEPKQNVAAGGSALSSLIKWARDNW
jgi:V8-like Glu-specific endopeptidase